MIKKILQALASGILLTVAFLNVSFAADNQQISCRGIYGAYGKTQSINLSTIISPSTNLAEKIKDLTDCNNTDTLICNANLSCINGTTRKVAKANDTALQTIFGPVNDYKSELIKLGVQWTVVEKFICKEGDMVVAGQLGGTGNNVIGLTLQCCTGGDINTCKPVEQQATSSSSSRSTTNSNDPTVRGVVQLCDASCANNTLAVKMKCNSADVVKCCFGSTPICMPIATASKLIGNLRDPNFTARIASGDPKAIKDLGDSVGTTIKTIRCGKPSSTDGSIWSALGGVAGGIIGFALGGPAGASAGYMIGSGAGSLVDGLIGACN